MPNLETEISKYNLKVLRNNDKIQIVRKEPTSVKSKMNIMYLTKGLKYTATVKQNNMDTIYTGSTGRCLKIGVMNICRI